MEKMKKPLALILCLVMCMTMLPTSVFAETEAEPGTDVSVEPQEITSMKPDESENQETAEPVEPESEDAGEEPISEVTEEPQEQAEEAAEPEEQPVTPTAEPEPTTEPGDTTEPEETTEPPEETTEPETAEVEQEKQPEEGESTIGFMSASSGSCGNNLTWTLDEDGLLTISGSGQMEDYSSDKPAPWDTSVVTVVFEEGVTSVGNEAFRGYNNLARVSFPESLITIGTEAFMNCSRLTEVSIPEGVTSIGDSAFLYCSKLSYVSIPASVTAFGEHVFFYSNLLQSAGPIGSGCNIEFGWQTAIPDNAFWGNQALTSVTIPDTVKSIGSHAFIGCQALPSITIPDSVTQIGEGAFCECYGLTSIIIPGSVVTIENDAFKTCNNLTTVKILSGVTAIGHYAFYNCSNLKTVCIPASVTAIGGYVFLGCDSIETVLYEGTEDQWNQITVDISNDPLLSATIVFGANEESSDNELRLYVAGTTDLSKTIYLRKNEEAQLSVDVYANDRDGITYVWQEYEFSSSYQDLSVKNTNTEEAIYAVTINDDNKKVICKAIDKYGNEACVLFLIRLDPQVGSCGEQLTWEMNAAGKLTVTGAGAMDNYTWIEEDQWQSVDSPWMAALYNEYAPEEYDYNHIKEISLPEGLTCIGGGAFRNLNSVREIEIPKTVTKIGAFAFSNCQALEKVAIPAGVTSIEMNAFSGCSSLTTVSYAGTEEQWSSIDFTTGNEALNQATVSYNGSTENPEDGIFYFTSLEELKTYLSKYGKDNTEAADLEYQGIYTGADELYINEDVYFPGNIAFEFNERGLVIEEGAVLTVDSSFSADTVTVNGRVVIHNGLSYLRGNMLGTLTVNGSAFIDGSVYVSTLNGAENIQYGDSADLNVYASVENEEAFYYYIDLSAKHKKLRCHIDLFSEITLSGDLCIPSGTELILHADNSSLTVPQGRTMTIKGKLVANGPLTVNGLLVNNGTLEISDDYETYSENIMFTSADSYQGDGTITLYLGPKELSQETFLRGLNLSDFAVTGFGDNCWSLHLKTGIVLRDGDRIPLTVTYNINTNDNTTEYWFIPEFSGYYFLTMEFGMLIRPYELWASFIAVDPEVQAGFSDNRFSLYNNPQDYPTEGINDTIFRQLEGGTLYQLKLQSAFEIDDFSLYVEYYPNTSCGEAAVWDIRENCLTIRGDNETWDFDYDSNPLPGWISEVEQIKTVIVEEGITRLNNLYGLSEMTTLNLPLSLSCLGSLRGAASLKTVYYAGTREQWTEIDISSSNNDLKGVDIICTDGVQDIESYCGNNVTWTYNDGTLVLEGNGTTWDCFYENGRYAPWTEYAQEISTVIINEGITAIGEDCFSYMPNLITVNLPESLLSIGYGAFQNCISLKNIELPSRLEILGQDVFFGCSSLERITIPEKISIIPYGTFMGCINLSTVSLPNGIWSIESAGFAGCESLLTVYYDGCPAERDEIEIELSEDNPLATATWIYAYSDEESPLLSEDSEVEICILNEEQEIEYTNLESYEIDRNLETVFDGIRLVAFTYGSAANEEVKWTISDKNETFASYIIAGNRLTVNPKKVSETGKVTVTASAQDGSRAKGTIVLDFLSYSTGVVIQEPISRYIVSGQQCQLRAELFGDPTNTNLIWSVLPEDEAFITVSTKGLVSAKTASYKKTVTVYADSADGASSTSIDLEYIPLTDEMEINLAGENVTGGKLNYNISGANTGLTFTAKGTPSDAEPNTAWTLKGKAGIASLAANADGSATIRAEGNGLTGPVTLTATAQDGSKKSANVTINFGHFAENIVILGAPEVLAFGASTTLKTNIASDRSLNDKTVIWHLREEDAPFASITDSGKLTANMLSEPVDIVVTAEAKANGILSDPKTIHLTPPAQTVDIYYNDTLQDSTLIGLDLANENFVLTARVFPELAAQNGLWTSSNDKIAVVDQTGKVTPVSSGTVKITFTSQDGSKKTNSVNLYVDTLVSDIEVYCAEENAEISTMSTDATALATSNIEKVYSVRAGKTLQLKANTFPLNVVQTKLIWSIVSGEEYATVNKATGLVTAKKGILETHKVVVKATTPYVSVVSDEYLIYVKPENDNIIRLLNIDNINITGTTVALSKGNNVQLQVKNAKDESLVPKAVNWRSSKPKVAEVASNGMVTAKSIGKADITVSYTVKGKTYSAKVTINVCVLAKGITVTSKNNIYDLFAGKTLTFTAAPTNKDATSKTFKWKLKSPIPNVTINDKGVLSADSKLREPTTAYIVAVATDGSGMESNPVTVSVWPKADSISIYVPTIARYNSADKTYIYTLSEGQSTNLQLYYAVLPNKSGKKTMQEVTWSSSDTKVAKIDKNTGNITIMKSGKVTITATSVDGYKKKSSLTLKFGTMPSAISIDQNTLMVKALKSGTMKAKLTNPYPEFGLIDSTVKWILPERVIDLLSGEKNVDGKTKQETITLLQKKITINTDNGTVTVKALGREDVNVINNLISQSDDLSTLGVQTTTDGKILLSVTAVSIADPSMKATATLTVTALSDKELEQWNNYEKHKADKKKMKKMNMNESRAITPQISRYKKNTYKDKNGQKIYYDKVIGYCTFCAHVTLMNRYVAWTYGDSTLPFNINNVYSEMAKKKVEYEKFSKVYLKGDKEVGNSNKDTVTTYKRTSNGSYWGITTDVTKVGCNAFKNKNFKMPYKGVELVSKEIKMYPQKKNQAPYKGKKENRSYEKSEAGFAALLNDHPEGVWIWAPTHAVVLTGYTYNDGKYTFEVADSYKSGDNGTYFKDYKNCYLGRKNINGRGGYNRKLQDIEEVRVIVEK